MSRNKKLFSPRRRMLGKLAILSALLGGSSLVIFRKRKGLSWDTCLNRNDQFNDVARSFAQSLTKISAAILPGEISAQERQYAVDGFVEWLAEYREGVGSAQFLPWHYSINKKTRQHPISLYRCHLEQLDGLASQMYDNSLYKLDRVKQQVVIQKALTEHMHIVRRIFRFLPGKNDMYIRRILRTLALPGEHDEHIIHHFLRFYFTNYYGINRVYQSAIFPHTCRGWSIDSPPRSWPT